MKALITLEKPGLYCPAGDFYIDPSRVVERAVITHAHGDHAYKGSQHYYCAESSLSLLRHRLGKQAKLTAIPYGQPFTMGDVLVSFHPAGHILGSSQIRIEANGEVWVFSGDYKRAPDPSCEPFEVVPCNTFITETTFASPVYRWPKGSDVAQEILEWWEENRKAGKASILFCYALGKAQRVLAELSLLTDRQVIIHGTMENMIDAYREAGIQMLETIPFSQIFNGQSFSGDLILAPPWTYKTAWMSRMEPCEAAFASGWMRIRGTRRRKGYDRGFVLSDHADWQELLQTVAETGAKQVYTTHGSSDTLVKYLNTELGISTAPLLKSTSMLKEVGR